jgi:sulfur carrier protein ThiS
MKIFIEKDNFHKEIKLKEIKTLKEVLFDLDISINSVILVKNGEVCLEEEEVKDTDEIKILSVVSGG